MDTGAIRRELLLQSMLLRYPARQQDGRPAAETCRPGQGGASAPVVPLNPCAGIRFSRAGKIMQAFPKETAHACRPLQRSGG